MRSWGYQCRTFYSKTTGRLDDRQTHINNSGYLAQVARGVLSSVIATIRQPNIYQIKYILWEAGDIEAAHIAKI